MLLHNYRLLVKILPYIFKFAFIDILSNIEIFELMSVTVSCDSINIGHFIGLLVNVLIFNFGKLKICSR